MEQNLNTFLSRFWYCPKDKTKMAPIQSRYVPTPIFTITREHVEIGLQNAAAVRKIPQEQVILITEHVKSMLDAQPTVSEMSLIGVTCPTCNTGYAAPRISQVETLGKNIGRALYDQHTAIEMKQYGRFRFVDHFGLTRDRNDPNSSSRMFYMAWWLGLRFLILYYLLGLQMKLLGKWIPLGVFLLIGGIIFLGLVAAYSGAYSVFGYF